MSDFRKEIELLVRANLGSSRQTLQSFGRSIGDIENALDRQTAAAKRGEQALDELKGTQAALADAQRQLVSRAGEISMFQKMADAITKAETRVKSTAAAYQDYKVKLDAAESVTDKQQAKLIKLSQAHERAQAALDKQRTSQQQLNELLSEAGIDTAKLTESEAKVRDLAAQIGIALSKANDAVKNYADNVRLAREEQKKLADAEAAAVKSAEQFAAAEQRAANAARARAQAAEEVAQAERNRNAQRAGDQRAAAEDAAAVTRARELAALRADIEQRSAESARDAQLFATAEEKAAKAARDRAQAAADVQAAQQARATDNNGQRASDQRAAVEEQARITRARELAALRADIEERSAQAAKDTGLRQQANDALAATKQYQTLAKAATDLTPKVVSLRDAVQAIVNPGGAARSTLEGVEAQVTKLSAAVDAIKGPVKDYDTMFRELTASQKALAQQAGLIDSFKQQVIALRAARAEFVNARGQVQQYAAAVAQGGEQGERFTKALADAQNRARQAANALRDQVQTTRSARDALRGAGVETNDLSGAESRLTGTTRQATEAVRNLAAAVDQYGQANQRAKKGSLFGDEGRTTLSFAQRFRGELLALTATYTGLQGQIDLASKALDAFNERAATKSTLAVALNTTDRSQIDNEYDYIKAQSDRIGLVYNKAADLFSKFSVAAAKSGRSKDQIHFIFEAFAEGGRVLGLTDEKMERIFVALQQIFNKGKIQAEELKQQLGDSLPAAFEIAQQALKKQFPDLNKAMQEGKVGAENLITIAAAYRDMVAKQLPAATQSLVSNQARMTNAVNDFKLAIADAGFADAWINALKQMTEFFKSDEGKQFAQTLASKFTLVADALVILVKNLDTVISMSAGFFAIWAAGRMVGVVNDFKAFAVGAKGAAGAMGLVSKAVLVFQALVVGWEIGTVLNDKFESVRQFGVSLVVGMSKMWATIKANAEIAWLGLGGSIENVLASIINMSTIAARQVVGIFAKIARAGGLDGVADALESAVKATMVVGSKAVDEAIAKRKAALAAELKQIDDVGFESFQAASDKARLKQALAPNPAGKQTATPDFTPSKPGPTDAEIKKRQNEIDRIRKALEDLDSRTEKSKKDSLDAQLAAFDLKTAELKRDIVKLGGAEGSAFLKQFDELRFQARQAILKKFNDDLLKESEENNRKVEAAEAAAGRRSKFALDDRLKAVELSYEATYRQIADERQKLLDNGLDTTPADQKKARLDVAVNDLKVLESRKFATEELKRKEQEVNDVIKLRDDRIKAIRDKVENGQMTDVQAAQQINTINQQAAPAIAAAATQAKDWANAHKDIFAHPEMLDLFLSQMDVLAGKATNVKREFDNIGNSIIQSGQGAVSQGLDAWVTGLGEIITRQKSVSQGFRDIARSSLNVFAQFLRDIAIAIIKMQIFNLMKQSGNPYIAAIGTAGSASVGVKHAGGMIGAAGGRSRAISPAWFSNAPRYHTGGFPGLANDEVPIIAQKGEEMLSKDSPRNLMNGGAAANGAGSDNSGKGVRFVLVDDRSRVHEAMQSPEGDQVIVQSIRKNASTIKQLMK